jgi:hypothetical protein
MTLEGKFIQKEGARKVTIGIIVFLMKYNPEVGMVGAFVNGAGVKGCVLGGTMQGLIAGLVSSLRLLRMMVERQHMVVGV